MNKRDPVAEQVVAVELRKRRLSALTRAEKKATNPEFKELWSNIKEKLLKLDI
jgi:hypothetical protein